MPFSSDMPRLHKKHSRRPENQLLLTSPWPRGKCVRFGAGRSRVRLLSRSYQDLVNWYCGLLTRRTVCGKICRELTQNIKTGRVNMKPEIVQTQSWRYKTMVVIKRQHQTISNKQTITTCVSQHFAFWITRRLFSCSVLRLSL